ncbi:hypothetical protein [Streptomyces sp. NBC_01233]|uniref:hypothetical protein n=1 Tax=Streptomyces sp. NBC_01233 TaxID=2903787 RepID=UPI002E133B20|nr:hypothetical protein OG332_10600 [Streptomyces sp. NBC_01233]
MTAVLLAVAVVAGYLVGRARPARWLGRTAIDWADSLDYRRPPVSRREWRWWVREAIYAPIFVWMLATQPRKTLHAWRTRNDPPPPRSPAPVLVNPWPPDRGPR